VAVYIDGVVHSKTADDSGNGAAIFAQAAIHISVLRRVEVSQTAKPVEPRHRFIGRG
jgi:hypothetical protein